MPKLVEGKCSKTLYILRNKLFNKDEGRNSFLIEFDYPAVLNGKPYAQDYDNSKEEAALYVYTAVLPTLF